MASFLVGRYQGGIHITIRYVRRNQQTHTQLTLWQDVLYIGRYDWSWHCGNPTVVREALHEEVGFQIPDKEGLNEGELQELEIQAQIWGCYMMLLGAGKYSPGFWRFSFGIAPCRGDRTAATDIELTFASGGGERFGTFLSMPGTEYEFGKFGIIPKIAIPGS